MTVAKPGLRVLSAGLLTTVQDGGRRGMQRYGVPPSGAADAEGLELANLLAGNPPGTAGLEVTARGPRLAVACGSVRVALGGDADAEIEGPNGRLLPAWSAQTLRRGERLRIGAVRSGLRCYLAVSGGFAIDAALGSASTYLRGGIGGIAGRAVRAGDELGLRLAEAPAGADLHFDPVPSAGSLSEPLRVVPGPQDDLFSPAALATLLASTYTVSPRSDRLGLRLEGPPLPAAGAEFASDACVTGSIQVTGGGLPIALLCDRGTTGGYPKIATVISVDVPRLGRLRPGETIRFASVDVAEAERLRRARARFLDAMRERLQPR
jgi:biotin-dependent carboxylase-like uncharacterized protein